MPRVRHQSLRGDGVLGTVPDQNNAAPPEIAQPLFDRFVEEIRRLGARVETGSFGAMMRVRLVNEGPVTFQIEI